jgi:hypothetical protein
MVVFAQALKIDLFTNTKERALHIVGLVSCLEASKKHNYMYDRGTRLFQSILSGFVPGLFPIRTDFG